MALPAYWRAQAVSAVAHLDALARALVARGFPAVSTWWLETLIRFYSSGRRQLVLRVGRRGGKSSTLCRIAVLEALFGQHIIPPGDVGVVAIISVSRDEAAQRLRTIRAILDALGIKYRPIESGIELEGRPVVFKTFAASVAGVSGFTCVCAIADEVAKWRDADTGANPASEVLASLRPTMATQPHARIFLSSSPLSTVDAHFEAFELGDTPFQVTAYAPSWVANPSLSEEGTRGLEPDGRRWAREYLAVPQAAVNAAFDADAIDRAFKPRMTGGYESAEAVLVIDPSSGRSDAWAWGLARYIRDERGRWLRRGDGEIRRWPDGSKRAAPDWKPMGAPILRFEALDGVEGNFWSQVSGGEIVDRLVAIARREGVRQVHADQREALMLSSAFERAGLRYHSHDWTGQSKPLAVEAVRRWLREGTLWLPTSGKGDALKRELLQFEERLTPAGQFTFRGRGTTHDDYVALLLTCALADADPGLPFSPYRRAVPRGMGQSPILPY